MPIQYFNNEQYVAHYTKFETVVEYVIPTNTVKINSIKNMNDPYENKQYWFDSDSSGYGKEIEQYHHIKYLRSVLFDSIKIFASTYYEEIKNSTGLSGHVYCRPRMWAQYGNNHKGVCLIFNKEKLNSCFEKSSDIFKLYSDKVEYLEWLDIINQDLSIGFDEARTYIEDKNKFFEALVRNDFIKSKFFKKHYDWRDEHEYRWLVISNKTTDLYINFEDSLEAIVLGCDVKPVYFPIFKEYNVPVFYLDFVYGKYTCNRVNIDTNGVIK